MLATTASNVPPRSGRSHRSAWTYRMPRGRRVSCFTAKSNSDRPGSTPMTRATFGQHPAEVTVAASGVQYAPTAHVAEHAQQGRVDEVTFGEVANASRGMVPHWRMAASLSTPCWSDVSSRRFPPVAAELVELGNAAEAYAAVGPAANRFPGVRTGSGRHSSRRCPVSRSLATSRPERENNA
jgi:hypothetical protein